MSGAVVPARGMTQKQDALRRIEQRPFLRKLLEYSDGDITGKRVLEIGSGYCYDLRNMRKAGADAYGLETRIRHEHPLSRELFEQGVLRYGEAERIESVFPEGRFEYIVSNAVMSAEGLGITTQEWMQIAKCVRVEELSARIKKVTERVGNAIHKAVIGSLKRGGVAIHFVDETLIGTQDFFWRLGYEVVEQTQRHVVLLRPSAKD